MTVGKRRFTLSVVFAAIAAGVAVGASGALVLASLWQTSAGIRTAEQRGRDIAVLVCARCHAISAQDKSPVAKAPAFRAMVSRLSVEGLQDQLEVGLSLGHRPMPPWNFSPEQADDLLVYMASLQVMEN